MTVVTVTAAEAVLLRESVTVNVQVPAATDVTVTVVPLTLAVTMPEHPDAVYGPATPSVILSVCGFAVVASNVSDAADSDSGIGVGVAVGVGDALAVIFGTTYAGVQPVERVTAHIGSDNQSKSRSLRTIAAL